MSFAEVVRALDEFVTAKGCTWFMEQLEDGSVALSVLRPHATMLFDKRATMKISLRAADKFKPDDFKSKVQRMVNTVQMEKR